MTKNDKSLHNNMSSVKFDFDRPAGKHSRNTNRYTRDDLLHLCCKLGLRYTNRTMDEMYESIKKLAMKQHDMIEGTVKLKPIYKDSETKPIIGLFNKSVEPQKISANSEETPKRHKLALRREELYPDLVNLSYDCEKDCNKMVTNHKIVNILTQYVLFVDKLILTTSGSVKQQNTFRKRQMLNVVNIIKSYPDEITNGRDLAGIKGIGKGSIDRIDEILETGTLRELSSDCVCSSQKMSKTDKIVTELSKIHGIADSIGRRLVKHFGIVGIDDLISKYKSGEINVTKNEISEHIAVGLKFYEDIAKKIPFDEVRKIGSMLKKYIRRIDKSIILKVCGSHRRKLKESGDIDVLITHPDFRTSDDIKNVKLAKNHLIRFVNLLTDIGFLVGHLTKKGKTKYMGVCKLDRDGDSIARRIDIRFVPNESFYTALLYFTGSGEFNVRMRTVANERGMTLNEYGLYEFYDGIKGKGIPNINSEYDIFDIIGIKYLEPWDRI